MPSLCQISSRSTKRCTRNMLQFFLPICEFWCPSGTPSAKVHQSWKWRAARPDLSMCQISSGVNLCTRYLQSNFTDFVDGVTEKQTNKHINKCISEGLMQVAAWYHGSSDQSSQNLGNNCQLTRPLTRPNFVILRQEAWHPLLKICHPGKMDQSSPKSPKPCYAPTPLTLPYLVALWQKMCDISAVENFWSRKSRPQFTKFGQ